MTAVDDEKIVELYLSRDEAAIRATSEKYGGRLRALSFGIVCDHETAEECENDTYLEAWNSIPPHEPRDYLYAFLARITRHVSLNRCRDRDRLKRRAFICELSGEMEQCLPDPDDETRRADDIALGEVINKFLGSLDEEKRNIFIRRYWFMESYEEIAKALGTNAKNISVKLIRTRERLKKFLKERWFCYE
jgi:RNA polymerase sigma-70 factor (ECF subfamily)